MKKHHAWILYTLLGINGVWAAQQIPPAPLISAPPKASHADWKAVRRSENQTRWESNVRQTNAVTGKVTTSRRSYEELGAGLNVRTSQGDFRPSNPAFSITAAGAQVTGAAHQVSVPGDIGAGEGVKIVTPKGQALGFQPVAVNYFDPTDGTSVLLDSVTNATGWLVASNEIIFSNCFPQIKASIRLRNLRSGLESDLILHERPPAPSSFGLSKRTRLEMITEQVSGESPLVRTNVVRKEKDPALRRALVEPDLMDEALAFNGMTMMPGKAFSLPRAETSNTERLFNKVVKSYLTMDGRRFLVEAVEYEQVQRALERLPAGRHMLTDVQRYRPSPSQLATRPVPSRAFKNSAKLMPPTASRAIQQAAVSRESDVAATPNAFVIDYQLINSSTLADFTFQCDTTYVIAESVSMEGTTTLEGGTVLKYVEPGALFFITEGYTLQCKTEPYRPAVFTAYDDNTVGELLPGSTGVPSQVLVNSIYFINGTRTLENVRFSHLYLPVVLETSDGAFLARNVQVVDVNYFLECGGADISIYNGLFYNCGSVVMHGFGAFTGEHLTVHNASVLGIGSTSASVKNSLFVNVAEHPPSGMGSYSETATEDLPSASGVFQTVGAGAHYLVHPSPYRNAGTTNINATLLAGLRRQTTYPPLIIAPPGAYYSTSHVLIPQASRDTDLPDLGYHYEPIDYALSYIYLTNASIKVRPGTALAVFNTTNFNVYGLALAEGASFSAEGRADNKVTITHYTTAQEVANTDWAGPIHSLLYLWNSTSTSEFRGRFTDWTVLGGAMAHLDGQNYSSFSWNLADVQFHGGATYNYFGSLMFLTNCLFNRNYHESFALDSATNYLRHCTFNGGTFYNIYSDSQFGVMSDSLFAGTTIYANPTNNCIAYTTNCYGRLEVTNLTDVHLDSLAFQQGTLGYFYTPTNSALIDAGCRNATNAGFYHYTMLTNNVKEAGTPVDIGFHYVATDAYGVPFDYDNDGVPDYWEDTNGNGVLDSGEVDWQDAEDLGLKVIITRPRENSVIP
jgi:hypothetical protein